MKIKDVHYLQIKNHLLSLGKEKILGHKTFLLHATNKPKDLEKRLRWDTGVWSMPQKERQLLFDEIYTYADDSHIDTALKKAIQEVLTP